MQGLVADPLSEYRSGRRKDPYQKKKLREAQVTGTSFSAKFRYAIHAHMDQMAPVKRQSTCRQSSSRRGFIVASRKTRETPRRPQVSHLLKPHCVPHGHGPPVQNTSRSCKRQRILTAKPNRYRPTNARLLERHKTQSAVVTVRPELGAVATVAQALSP